LIDLNKSAESLLGFGRERKGRAFDSLLTGGDLAPLRELVTKALHTSKKGSSARVELTSDKKRGLFQVRIARLGLRRCAVTFEEFNAKEYDKLSAYWAVVARAVAHKMGRPLKAMKFAAQDIEEESPLSVANARLIAEGVAKLSYLTESLTKLAGFDTALAEPVDVAELIRKSLKGHEKLSDFALPDVPEVTPKVSGSEEQLVMALENIINNAVEATQGKRAPRISVRTVDRGESVEIEVEDSGGGIPESITPRLFRPFVTTKEDGHGLGLVISKKILEDAGGSISFTSRTGSGTTFRIKLPARRTDHE
jgi:C4-dicarboxylate-specific signal transduction histidine kinase